MILIRKFVKLFLMLLQLACCTMQNVDNITGIISVSWGASFEKGDIITCLKGHNKTLDNLIETSKRLNDKKLMDHEDDKVVSCTMEAMGVITSTGVDEDKLENLLHRRQINTDYSTLSDQDYVDEVHIQDMIDCVADEVKETDDTLQKWIKIRTCAESHQ